MFLLKKIGGGVENTNSLYEWEERINNFLKLNSIDLKKFTYSKFKKRNNFKKVYQLCNNKGNKIIEKYENIEYTIKEYYLSKNDTPYQELIKEQKIKFIFLYKKKLILLERKS